MKNIGMLHYQVGGTDGVSLEMDKWKRVLEEMGYRVHLCAGNLGSVSGTLIPEMYHHLPEAERLYFNTFVRLRDYADDASYSAELIAIAETVQDRLQSWVQENSLDFLIANNLWSVAVNPPVAIALAQVMRDLRLPTLAHHHDFYWERTDGVGLTTSSAVELADKYLPPRDPLLRHVVINSLAQRQLYLRKGIQSLVVPNAFDFGAPGWCIDDHSRDFRARMGLRAQDIVILQATRIVRRKGIELAVDFVRALNEPERRARLSRKGLYDSRPFDQDSRIVLVLAGYTRDDPGGRYVQALREKIGQSGIDALFIGDLVDARRQVRNGQKVYSLWDTYVVADFVTYPSLWEGWGNQFLEALRARVPIMLFEYPVYAADIKKRGFRVVSLGSEIAGRDERGLVQAPAAAIERAADRAVDLLTDAELRQSTVEHNFQLGCQHYSLDALRQHLELLMSDAEGG